MNYQFDDFFLDTTNFRLLNGSKDVAIEPQVIDLLIYLIEHRERLVSRQEIFDNIWAGRKVCDTSLSNHIKSARKALGDNGRSQQIIKTIHGRGYQFIAKIQTKTQILHHDNQPERNVQRRYQFTLGSLAALVLVIFIIPIISNVDGKTPNNLQPSIAVLPLANTSPAANSDYFGFVLADQIIGNFANLKNLTVSPSSLIRQYAGQAYNVISVGNDLNVDYVLSGNYIHQNKKISVNLELINIRTNKLLWRLEQYEVVFNNTCKLQDIVAKHVIKGLKIDFSEPEFNRIHHDMASNAIVYKYYF